MAFAGVGRTAVDASRSLARPTRRRLRALVVVVAPWHWSGAARCVLGQWPAASHVVCTPAHPCASPLRGISPARWSARPPPVGAPSARAPLLLVFATGLVAGHARNTGATGLTACKPAWPLAYFHFFVLRFLHIRSKPQKVFKHCRRIRKIVLHPPLHRAPKKKACYRLNSRLSLYYLGWLMGLEPTTTGITILDSTN